MQSRYVLRKPLVVMPWALPTDVYQFRFEVDLAPTYIYRLTPVFDTKLTDESGTTAAVQSAWDEVNNSPLDKFSPKTLVQLKRLAAKLGQGNTLSENDKKKLYRDFKAASKNLLRKEKVVREAERKLDKEKRKQRRESGIFDAQVRGLCGRAHCA